MLKKEDVSLLLQWAGIETFTGDYRPLGGGELNETYAVNLTGETITLRIEKHPNQNSLPDEARALSLLDGRYAPRLIFFDAEQIFQNRMWILEGYVSGRTPERLTVDQYYQLGQVLAYVHSIQPSGRIVSSWELFVSVCKNFSDEEFIRSHPHPQLQEYIGELKDLSEIFDKKHHPSQSSLIHGDATPSNIIISENNPTLIDWEFSKISDPMMEFSTIYYDDMEYNQGKWRVQISAEEKQGLFKGYEDGGGNLQEDRINFWMWFDKLGAAVFLYWKLNESKREIENEVRSQNIHDFNQLLDSLTHTKPIL